MLTIDGDPANRCKALPKTQDSCFTEHSVNKI